MPTDEERREVARRLREAASYYESMGRDVDFYPVESALGLEPVGEIAYTPESVRSLADLIEPSCDRDALLKVADMLECDGECSECECGKGTFCEAPTIAAARIREALGVEL